MGTEEGKEVAGVSLAEVVWLEWEPNDRENPFNVRLSPALLATTPHKLTTLRPRLLNSRPPGFPFGMQWSKRKKWQTCLIACFFTLVRDRLPSGDEKTAQAALQAAEGLTSLLPVCCVLWHRLCHGHAVSHARSELLA